MTADEIRALADKMESMASFVARVLGHSVDAHDCHRAAAALRELVDLLEKHRRYHSKVGCPGEECYVCEAEDAAMRAEREEPADGD